MHLILATVGHSGAGKSHFCNILHRHAGYQIIRYSDAVKELVGEFDGDERAPYRHRGRDYKSYKHYLCSVAAHQNLTNPTFFTDWVESKITAAFPNHIALDGLRSPFQLSRLQKTVANSLYRLVLIRVTSPNQYVVSGMDTLLDGYVFPVIENNGLTDLEIIEQFSITLQKELR